jgi:DNA-binding transcriptional LysR family regulator
MGSIVRAGGLSVNRQDSNNIVRYRRTMISQTGRPDLESLACVDALARTLRFHVAARSCALSPAAFSKRVQQAEEQLGVSLFQRTTRSVQLTDRGAVLLPRIRQILADAEGLTSTADVAAVDVVIGTRHELGMSWLLPARKALKQALPHVTTHLRFGSTEELEQSVQLLRTDAIVISRAPATRRLVAIDLHHEAYDLVASPRLLARVPLRRADDAAGHVLVDADDALPLFSYFRASGVPLQFGRTLTLGAIEAILAAVLDGEGVAVLPRYFVKEHVRRRRLRRLLPRAVLGADYFRMIFRADDPRRALLARIAAVLASLPLR